MTPADLIWAAFALGGATWLLYRSFWKKKGCSTCSGCSCNKK